jgi:hypothetical protein
MLGFVALLATEAVTNSSNGIPAQLHVLPVAPVVFSALVVCSAFSAQHTCISGRACLGVAMHAAHSSIDVSDMVSQRDSRDALVHACIVRRAMTLDLLVPQASPHHLLLRFRALHDRVRQGVHASTGCARIMYLTSNVRLTQISRHGLGVNSIDSIVSLAGHARRACEPCCIHL